MPKQKPKLPAVIGMYGYSKSGKTTLIERVIRQLTHEGRRVAAVKVSGHAASLDEPGKDTWRFTHAGAGAVALSAQSETALMFNHPLKLDAILRALELLQQPEVIIVEGANDPSVRKIRLGEIELRENTIWSYDGIYENLLEKIHTEMEKE